MLARLVQLVAGKALLFPLLLIVLLMQPAATATPLETPLETPGPESTDWIRTTVYATPGAGIARSGEVISPSVSLPAVYKAASLSVPAVYKLRSFMPPSPPPPSPAFIDLGTLGGPSSTAMDVNNRGQVVGYSDVSGGGDSGIRHAFLWQKGKMKDLGTLGGRNSTALLINELGQAAGDSEYGVSEDQHAFFWVNGRMMDIGTLGGSWSRAVDLNDRGQVVGVSSTAAGQTHCFLWAAGVMTDLGTLGGGACNVTDINNRGQIVGDSTPAGATSDHFEHAFLWDNGVMTDLTPDLGPDGESCALAVNELSQTIGFRGGTSGYCSDEGATLWADGTGIDLSYGGQGFRRIDAINDRGQVVGYGNLQCNCLPGGSPYCCTEDALLWDSGVLINLGVQERRWPNNTTLLNNRRQIVLGLTFWSGFPLYLWQDGALIPFEIPSDTFVSAKAINDAGAVAGSGDHALLWQIVSAAEQH